MRLKWLAPRFNLLLSILSLIVGLVGTLALNKWWVVVLVIPAVILFLLSFERARNVPCRPDCWLRPGLAKDIFATTIDPEQSPPCAHLTVEHSTGVVAATLTARCVLTTIIHLSRMLLLLEDEIQKEGVFSVDSLDTHTNGLQRIQAVAAGVISGGNFATQCYCIIPESGSIVQELNNINKCWQDNLLKEIADFRDSIPPDIERHVEVAPWKTKIRDLLIDRICPGITENVIKLQKLADPAREIVDSLVKDWHGDLRFLWEDYLCKPVPAEVLPEPKIKVKDIADSMNNG